ncbi:hypothetical protein [Bythopirellula polymerisocia]|nr:hypothetical protein [Bythopirellula polymerisocia]
MLRTPLRDLIVAVAPAVLATALGLVVSCVALFIAALFSMGFALQEPAVVVPILVVGPVLSLITWAVLDAKTRRAGSAQSETARVSPERGLSLVPNLLMLWCGAMLSLPLFLVVLLVENQFPGELKSDVFGPYYTHPFRPLSGIVLCLLGLATGAFLYNRFKMRYCAVGLSFGSVALGLVLIFAF